MRDQTRDCSRLCSKKNYKENFEIQGTQHKAYIKKVSLSGRPEAKVSCLRHPGAFRELPCCCIK